MAATLFLAACAGEREAPPAADGGSSTCSGEPAACLCGAARCIEGDWYCPSCEEDAGTGTDGGSPSCSGTIRCECGSAVCDEGDWRCPSCTGDAGSCVGTPECPCAWSGGECRCAPCEPPPPDAGSGACGAEGQSCCDGLCGNDLMCCTGVPYPEDGQCETACMADSDRNLKQGFECIDPAEVLARVVALPVSSWAYGDDEHGTRHIGPMAQDFHEAFQLGSNDRVIPLVDANGVTLAAIQGLHRRMEQLSSETSALRTQNEELRREIEQLRR